LIVSSYIPELLGTCDRIAVMSRGVLGAARNRAEWDERRRLSAALGQEISRATETIHSIRDPHDGDYCCRNGEIFLGGLSPSSSSSRSLPCWWKTGSFTRCGISRTFCAKAACTRRRVLE